jgi:hypothetical protein
MGMGGRFHDAPKITRPISEIKPSVMANPGPPLSQKSDGTAERRNPLLHQQHLARAFDGAGQAALVMGGQAGVFAGQDAALIGHKLPEQIGVLEIQRVSGEINLGFGPGRATFHRAARTTAIRFIGIGSAGHGYLISR